MGRGRSKQAQVGRKPPVKQGRPPAVAPADVLSDSDDEPLDEFKAGSAHIAFDGEVGVEDDSEMEEVVYQLDDEDEDDESDDGEDGEGEEDDLLDEAIEAGGRLSRLAKQARVLEQRLKLQQGEEEEEGGRGDREAEEEPGAALWGPNKRAYYSADTAEASDEEARMEEEREAVRLARERAARLTPADFGLEGDGASEEETSNEGEDGDSGDEAAGASGRAQVEVVLRDGGASDAADAALGAAASAEAPELAALLEELRGSLEEVRHRIGPLLAEVRSGGLATADGLSYLEAKHLLLLHYSLGLVFFLMMKAEGRSVRSHPVVERLVEVRAYLERVRPIDRHLSYQIQKLLRATQIARASDEANGDAAAAAAPAAADGDDAALRPNPAALVAKGPGRAGGTGASAAAAAGNDGVYRPPKLNPVSMEDDAREAKRERRRLQEAQRRAARSGLVRELAEELAGAPEELVGADAASGAGGLGDGAAGARTRARLAARAEAEEELFVRVPLSKDEAKRLRAQRRAGLSGQGLLEDFADEVADLVDASGGGTAKPGGGLAELFGRQRLSQKFGADMAGEGSRMRSADADVPRRAPLGDRRAAYDAVAARRGAALAGDDGDSGDEDGGLGKRRAGEEDDFYSAAKEARSAAKRARSAAHTAPALPPPLPDREASGPRKITREIQANRGLTPHRRKDLKNPRKKHRVKYASAQVRRKGQVAEMRANPGTGYAGEPTGIKAKVAKSTRF